MTPNISIEKHLLIMVQSSTSIASQIVIATLQDGATDEEISKRVGNLAHRLLKNELDLFKRHSEEIKNSYAHSKNKDIEKLIDLCQNKEELTHLHKSLDEVQQRLFSDKITEKLKSL